MLVAANFPVTLGAVPPAVTELITPRCSIQFRLTSNIKYNFIIPFSNNNYHAMHYISSIFNPDNYDIYIN
jgi:hypothetical protein